MSLEFAEGRPKIAEHLHSIEEANQRGKDKNMNKLLIIHPAKEESHLKEKSKVEVVEKKGIEASDVWISSGLSGVWTREHRKPRRSLFTPMRVARGPAANTHFLKIRETQ